MTRNHNLNQLCLLTTKNHCFRNKSVTFMILYENEIDHLKSGHLICFCYLGLTNRRDLVISNYNLRRTEVKQTKTVLINVQTLVKSENQNPWKDTYLLSLLFNLLEQVFLNLRSRKYSRTSWITRTRII